MHLPAHSAAAWRSVVKEIFRFLLGLRCTTWIAVLEPSLSYAGKSLEWTLIRPRLLAFDVAPEAVHAQAVAKRAHP